MRLDETNSNQKASDIDLAYCRAALYSALMLGFQPPTEETLSRLLAETVAVFSGSRSRYTLSEFKSNLICKIDALP